MAGILKKKSSKKESSIEENSKKSDKKASMKTAEDVISRLLWDDSLPQDKFIVGYLDRFDGIMEKPFTSLDWRNPAIVDNHTLALPKHRIQYFKYHNRKVWDKRNRTDVLFGSTGYLLSIHDFIARVDNDAFNFCDADITTEISMDRAYSDDPEEAVNEEDFDEALRPNYFIAARITNEETVKNLKEVSDYIKEKDELLGQCCITPPMLHMTFSILKLDSPGDVCEAISALKALSERKLPDVILSLEGLDLFKHRVLYARVDDNENLSNLRGCLIDELVSRNIQITDRFSFVPHVTVAKLSRPVTRLRHSKYIDQYLYLLFEDNEFGSQHVDKLYLCEMGADPREDGFYKCAFEVALTKQ